MQTACGTRPEQEAGELIVQKFKTKVNDTPGLE